MTSDDVGNLHIILNFNLNYYKNNIFNCMLIEDAIIMYIYDQNDVRTSFRSIMDHVFAIFPYVRHGYKISTIYAVK